VFGSTIKETCYFVDPGTHMFDAGRNYLRGGIEGYKQYFIPPRDQHPNILLESTPSYLYYKTPLEILPDIESRPKFVFILREPAQQVFSVFNYFRNNWDWIPAEMDFQSFLGEVEQGKARFGGNELAENALAYANYFDYLSHWLDRVGAERLYIGLFEDMLKNPVVFMEALARWLNLDPVFYASYGFPTENKTYSVRSRALQKINIAMRESLPRGLFYSGARSVYRALNTSNADKLASEDAVIIRALRERFCEPNRRLANAFGLNLSAWQSG
jgi:hypothetical protein